MRVLLIATASPHTNHLLETLENRGFVVDAADDADDGAALAKSYEYDAVVLCADFDGPDGLPALVGLRRARIATPLMVVSRTGTVEARVAAFHAGADEYMVRPVNPIELCCRLHAIVRRARGHPRSVIRTGRMEIDVEDKCVRVDGRPVRMTPREYAILEALSLRKGAVLHRNVLFEHVYGAMDETSPRNVDVYISHIRKKLVRLCGRSYIETEWGRGFALRDGEGPTRSAA
jgi:two-component system cell cycle response regulator CtrA